MNTSPGYTLIEMAIGLVIVGLVMGGILIGNNLIKAGELRKSITQSGEYKNATMVFKEAYFGMPGDITNASGFWPNCDPTPTNCDGNGNGIINTSAEAYRAWQQLANAGLIQGNFSGTSTGSQSVIGVNTPASAIKGAGYSIYHYGPVHTTWYAPAAYINVIYVGKSAPAGLTVYAVLDSSDARFVDEKIDDGVPSSGMVTSNKNLSCTDGATPGVYSPNAIGSCALAYSLE